MATSLKLNRQQLAQFLPTQEAIRAFESLFALTGDAIPSDLESTQIDATTAQIQAAEALAGLAQIANALSLSLFGAQKDIIQEDGYSPPVSLGTMAEQNADRVSIKGGTISVSDVTNGNVAALASSSVILNNGAAAGAGTITNAPAAGNPTKWIPIRDNGVTRYIPAW